MKNTVLWLNAFPKADGISKKFSPFYIIHGRHLTFDLHARCLFVQYVQTHEEHSNGMEPHTTGAICLGPTGNAHGTHYFFSLTTGQRIERTRWTELPMPQDVIDRINSIGRKQGMPTKLTFANRHAHEIRDHLEDFADDDGQGSYYSTSEHEDDSDFNDASIDPQEPLQLQHDYRPHLNPPHLSTGVPPAAPKTQTIANDDESVERDHGAAPADNQEYEDPPEPPSPGYEGEISDTGADHGSKDPDDDDDDDDD
jgi:hypothetical protein